MAPGRLVGKAITFYCENSFDLRDLLKGPLGDRGPHCESWGPDRAFLPQALEESVILPVEDSSLNFSPFCLVHQVQVLGMPGHREARCSLWVFAVR